MSENTYCAVTNALESNCRAWALVVDDATKVVTLMGLMGLTNNRDDMVRAALHEMCVVAQPAPVAYPAADKSLVCGTYDWLAYTPTERSGSCTVGFVGANPGLWWPWAQQVAHERGYTATFKLVAGGSSLAYSG